MTCRVLVRNVEGRDIILFIGRGDGYDVKRLSVNQSTEIAMDLDTEVTLVEAEEENEIEAGEGHA